MTVEDPSRMILKGKTNVSGLIVSLSCPPLLSLDGIQGMVTKASLSQASSPGALKPQSAKYPTTISSFSFLLRLVVVEL